MQQNRGRQRSRFSSAPYFAIRQKINAIHQYQVHVVRGGGGLLLELGPDRARLSVYGIQEYVSHNNLHIG